MLTLCLAMGPVHTILHIYIVYNYIYILYHLNICIRWRSTRCTTGGLNTESLWASLSETGQGPASSIFHCFKRKCDGAQLWNKKLLLICAQNMLMLRTSLSSQNLRLEHYNSFTFSNLNKLNHQVSPFSFWVLKNNYIHANSLS